MHGFLPSYDAAHYSNPYYYVRASQKLLWFTLPDANEDPPFYVGRPSLVMAIVGVVSSAVQNGCIEGGESYMCWPHDVPKVSAECQT